jgi:hypothetical protein
MAAQARGGIRNLRSDRSLRSSSLDRLHGRLLNCRLSRDGAAGDFNAAANVDNKNENGHGMVTP